MKNKILNICKLISIVLLSALVVFLGFVDIYGVRLASAETSAEVLQDLRKDKDFNESDYPYVADDYGLHIIQIAESSNRELFVYAYQPCNDTLDLVGTKISISYGYSLNGSGLTPKLYNLRLISTSGTLDKYYVQDFTVPNDGDRYYNIVEIFRIFNSDIDESDEEFPKTDIAYSVGQQWYVCDLNKSKHYEMNTFDTLYLDTVFNGSLKVSKGFTFGTALAIPESCDIWFYCFNQEDYVIKHIYDADLTYSMDYIQKGIDWGFSQEVSTTNICTNEVLTLKDTDTMTYKGNGIGAREFNWKRIMKSSDFVSTILNQKVSVDEDLKAKILSSQWVFTYKETSYGKALTNGAEKYYNVYDVGLLRLHFQDTSGKYYDLGVVNDLTDPDNVPDGVSGIDFEEFWNTFVKAITLIIGVVLFILLINLVPPVKAVLKFIFNSIKTVILAPFKLLKSIFKKGG